MSTRKELTQSIVTCYLNLLRYQHRWGHRIHKEFEISGRQLAVLRCLLQRGPLNVREIARMLYISDATTSAILERMEQAGYVRRSRSEEDSRKVVVEPSEAGRQVAAQAPMGAVWRMREHLPELPVEELEAIDQAFKRVSEIARVDESLSR